MKILIEAPFTVSKQQEETINADINNLSTYNKKITQTDVFFKLDDGNKPDAVLAEVQLHVPGPVIFASATHENFMDAFNSALNKAKSQLLKRKDVMQDHYS